jgi:hypothetical protein
MARDYDTTLNVKREFLRQHRTAKFVMLSWCGNGHEYHYYYSNNNSCIEFKATPAVVVRLVQSHRGRLANLREYVTGGPRTRKAIYLIMIDDDSRIVPAVDKSTERS